MIKMWGPVRISLFTWQLLWHFKRKHMLKRSGQLAEIPCGFVGPQQGLKKRPNMPDVKIKSVCNQLAVGQLSRYLTIKHRLYFIFWLLLTGSAELQWLTLTPHSKTDLGSNRLTVCMFLSFHNRFPSSAPKTCRLGNWIAHKWPITIDWWPVQGVRRLLPQSQSNKWISSR